jgi:hypothetical protein
VVVQKTITGGRTRNAKYARGESVTSAPASRAMTPYQTSAFAT